MQEEIIELTEAQCRQTELTGLIGYGIGMRGEAYNPAVIADTLTLLHQMYSADDLDLMIEDAHPEYCGIEETIQIILTDTYSTINA